MNLAIRILSLTPILSLILGVIINGVPLTQNLVAEPALMLLMGSTLILVARCFRRENIKI